MLAVVVEIAGTGRKAANPGNAGVMDPLDSPAHPPIGQPLDPVPKKGDAMNRPSFRHSRIIAVAVATVGVLLPAGAQAHTAPPSIAAGCTINVTGGTHNCNGVPGISVLSLSGGRLLLRLSFTAGQTANLAVTYNAAPSGFTVNLGDSATNDGGGGDQGTQSNDAETMVQGQQMSAFGRDGTPTAPLLTVPNASLGAGKVASFEIADRKLCWSFGAYTCATSDWLYALSSQADTEGAVNNDIYAAFNRVVSGRLDRVGTGVSAVSVFLN